MGQDLIVSDSQKAPFPFLFQVSYVIDTIFRYKMNLISDLIDFAAVINLNLNWNVNFSVGTKSLYWEISIILNYFFIEQRSPKEIAYKRLIGYWHWLNVA